MIFSDTAWATALKQARVARMYASPGGGGKHAAVTSLKTLWQNQRTLLIYRVGHASGCGWPHHLLEPYQELQKKF